MNRRPIGLSVPYRKTTTLFTPEEVLEMVREAGFRPKWPETIAQFEQLATIIVNRANAKAKEK